jgi:hypothetical protein
MTFHPVIFALIAYGITIVIAACVTLIVRVIALAVRPKQKPPAVDAKPETKGGTPA